jgi:hypothetical protein
MSIAIGRYQKQHLSASPSTDISLHEKIFLMMGYTSSGPTRTLAMEIEAVKRAPDFMYEGADVPFVLVRYAAAA